MKRWRHSQGEGQWCHGFSCRIIWR